MTEEQELTKAAENLIRTWRVLSYKTNDVGAAIEMQVVVRAELIADIVIRDGRLIKSRKARGSIMTESRGSMPEAREVPNLDVRYSGPSLLDFRADEIKRIVKELGGEDKCKKGTDPVARMMTEMTISACEAAAGKGFDAGYKAAFAVGKEIDVIRGTYNPVGGKTFTLGEKP